MVPKSILFVCLGNICRSPLAEGIAKQIANRRGLDIEIDSCGTGTWHVGEAPCDDAIRVAKENGLDIASQRARQINSDDIEKFDLIVVLDDKNQSDVIAMGAKNVVKLGFYGYNNEDVPDPYFFPGYEGFDKVYSIIEECVVNLLDENS
ncbi:MAG: low molecular weight protein-tyrosine-phosphatase [Sulfurimonadaceae bacterium]